MAKKKRSAKQRANDKRLGARAKSRSKTKRSNNSNSSRKPVAKRKGKRSSKSVSIVKKVTSGSIFRGGLVGKAVMGVGAGALVGLVLDRVAPQFSAIGKPVAALVAGGPVGAVAQVLLTGGISSFGGIIGPNQPVQELSV